MALQHSPKTVTDSLIFYYDMLNIKKSWIGPTTTNLYGDFGTSAELRTNTQFNWDGTNWTSGSPGCDGPQEVNAGTVYKFVSGSLSSSWSGNSYGYMYKDIATTNGLVYTSSFWCYVSSDCNIDSIPATIEITSGSSASNIVSSYDMSKKGSWQRVGVRTTGAGGTSRFLIYPQRYGITDGSFTGYFLITAPQVEQFDFASPYVASSRANTQALLDLTNRNTITATSLTYNNNGTFSFTEASSNTLLTNVPLTAIPATSDFTLECWVKITAFPTAGTPVKVGMLFGAAHYTGAGIYWNGNTAGTAMNVYAYIRGQDAYRSTSLYSLNLNTWYHLVMVNSYTGNKTQLFVNGSLYNEVTGPSLPYNTTNTSVAGNIGISKNQIDGGGTNTYSFITGNVDIAKIYTIALTDSQILQNFNALRGRYGI